VWRGGQAERRVHPCRRRRRWWRRRGGGGSRGIYLCVWMRVSMRVSMGSFANASVCSRVWMSEGVHGGNWRWGNKIARAQGARCESNGRACRHGAPGWTTPARVENPRPLLAVTNQLLWFATLDLMSAIESRSSMPASKNRKHGKDSAEWRMMHAFHAKFPRFWTCGGKWVKSIVTMLT
jgi:hypothetical protein